MSLAAQVSEAAKGGRGQPDRPQSGMSALLEKTRLGAARRATPDSEALASSDDEHENMLHSTASLKSNSSANAKNGRRASSSWLNEIQSAPHRKASFTGTALSSNNSQPPTPSTENVNISWGPFGPTLGRVASNPATSPWNQSSIWGTDPRNSRLSEITSSPTIGFPTLQPRTSGEEAFGAAVGVGQTDEDASLITGIGNPALQQRGPRAAPLSAIRHRPSRPSMLGGLTESSNLAQLREVEDDDESSAAGSDQGVRLASPGLKNEHGDSGHSNLMKHVAIESAKARQRAASSSMNTTTEQYRMPFSHAGMADSAARAGAEYAVDEEGDDLDHHSLGSSLIRRYTELTGMGPRYPNLEDMRRSEDIKRAHWQSSPHLDNSVDEGPSRRNSVAGILTRRGSLVAAAANEQANFTPNYGNMTMTPYDDVPNTGGSFEPGEYAQFLRLSSQAQQALDRSNLRNRSYASTYFSGVAPALRSQFEASAASARGQMPTMPTYTFGGPYRQGPASSVFQRATYDTPLYIVSFKCARAEVFFVGDGTGLEVKEGDLVIVEADRGHDLGTVLHAKVSWPRAKELKERCAEEHYRWLMMFSRHSQSVSGDTVDPNGMMASARDRSGNDTGAVPPPGFEMGHGSELKPKMIKRLAQPHEIATLRDKEGNEAKAKRVCQQKVTEHRLNMEILDAEFQMDWKKLTFYYFADEYINFNLLVTDLFKIYKTRIWMSAINPASFASNALQPPSGLGPGALEGRDSPMDPSRRSLANDPDPLGAIPPSQNPTTRTYHETMLANRQTGANNHSQQLSQSQQYNPYMQYPPQQYYPGSAPTYADPRFTSPFPQAKFYQDSQQRFNTAPGGLDDPSSSMPSSANGPSSGNYNLSSPAPEPSAKNARNFGLSTTASMAGGMNFPPSPYGAFNTSSSAFGLPGGTPFMPSAQQNQFAQSNFGQHPQTFGQEAHYNLAGFGQQTPASAKQVASNGLHHDQKNVNNEPDWFDRFRRFNIEPRKDDKEQRT